MALFSRRLVIAAAMLASLAACSKGGASVGAPGPQDMTLGNPQAKVLVAEYASVACPHCAAFNNDIFPAFKAKYIDSGKVHYVLHEMLVGGQGEQAMAAAGFLLARCAGKDKYFAVTDEIFHQQEAIETSGDLRGGLLRIAQSLGMTEPQFNACIGDQTQLKALNTRVEQAGKDGIDSTPTFIINGQKLVGEQTLAQLDKAIADAEKK
ncbi:MAG TPA: DsbA family protein [Caulobacteraceae bacterium]|jgi:protein-disulfide isomerase